MHRSVFYLFILFSLSACQQSISGETFAGQGIINTLEGNASAESLASRTVRIDFFDPHQGGVTNRGIGIIVDNKNIITVSGIFSSDLTLNGLEGAPEESRFDIHSLQLDNPQRDMRVFDRHNNLLAEFKGVGLRDLLDGLDERLSFKRVHFLREIIANTKISKSIAMFNFSDIDFSQKMDLKPLPIVSGYPSQDQKLYFYRYKADEGKLSLEAVDILVDNKKVGIANSSYVKDTLIQINPTGKAYFQDGSAGAPLFGFGRDGKLQIYGMAAMIEVNNHSILNQLEFHSFMLFTDSEVKRFLTANKINFELLGCN